MNVFSMAEAGMSTASDPARAGRSIRVFESLRRELICFRASAGTVPHEARVQKKARLQEEARTQEWPSGSGFQRGQVIWGWTGELRGP